MTYVMQRYGGALARVFAAWFLLGALTARAPELFGSAVLIYCFLGLTFLVPAYRDEMCWGHRHARRLQRKLGNPPFWTIWLAFGPFLWPAMIGKC